MSKLTVVRVRRKCEAPRSHWTAPLPTVCSDAARRRYRRGTCSESARQEPSKDTAATRQCAASVPDRQISPREAVGTRGGFRAMFVLCSKNCPSWWFFETVGIEQATRAWHPLSKEAADRGNRSEQPS